MNDMLQDVTRRRCISLKALCLSGRWKPASLSMYMMMPACCRPFSAAIPSACLLSTLFSMMGLKCRTVGARWLAPSRGACAGLHPSFLAPDTASLKHVQVHPASVNRSRLRPGVSTPTLAQKHQGLGGQDKPTVQVVRDCTGPSLFKGDTNQPNPNLALGTRVR